MSTVNSPLLRNRSFLHSIPLSHMQLQKYKKMEINEPDNKIFSSSEVIEIVLKAVGLTRENLSTYKQYQYSNGFFLRLRVSNHGIYLQHWFEKNKKARMEGEKLPKLDIGVNIALTFAPNQKECRYMNETFPMKIRNVTTVKTQQGNNVKPQFTVKHFCYYSWKLSNEDISTISSSLSECIKEGKVYVDPLQGNPEKVVVWSVTSNRPPQKITGVTLRQKREKQGRLW